MCKSKFIVWFLALVFVCGSCGTSCESQKATESLAGAPQVAKQQVVEKPQDLLTYHEIYTAGARAGDPVPLIIAVHGLGDKPINFSSLFDDLPFKARVVLPRAPDPWGGGWAWFPYRFRDQDPRALAVGIENAAARVAELAAHLTAVSSQKPVICGFSQGGMISYAVALLHPQTVKGAVPISGTIPPDLLSKVQGAPERFPPIRALHGTADQIVTFPPTERATGKLAAKGLDIDLKVYEGVGHSVIAPMQDYLYKSLERLSAGE